MKKFACLLFCIALIGGALAACEKDVAPEGSSPALSSVESSSPEESSSEDSAPEETLPTTLTKEEWEALENVALYTNFTRMTTQIDSYYKTVSEMRVVDGYMYMTASYYNVDTGALEWSDPWHKMQIVSESMMFQPNLEDYEKIAHNAQDDVYYYVGEKVEMVADDEWHITKMEWRVADGKLVESYFEFWYMDEFNGTTMKVTGSSKNQFSAYGATVAPEGV